MPDGKYQKNRNDAVNGIMPSQVSRADPDEKRSLSFEKRCQLFPSCKYLISLLGRIKIMTNTG